jgi:hypothetical protein
MHFWWKRMKDYIPILISLMLVLVNAVVIKAEELKSVIPLSSELTDFRMNQKLEYYNKENLWRYINGSASSYLAYGFEEMVTFQVMNLKNRLEIVVDIYDMGNSLNAFGIFSVERVPEGRDLEFGIDSFQYDNTLFFWQDKYYVKLMAYDMTPKTVQFLSLLAQIMTQKIPEKGKRPHLLTVFPEKGRLKKSERYIKRDVLGQEYFADGYSIDYDRDNNQYKIFLICGKSPKETKQSFQKYLAFIKTVGHITDKHIKIGEQAFAGTHNYYGKVLFARKGRYIVGFLGFDNQNFAQEIIISMFSRLT